MKSVSFTILGEPTGKGRPRYKNVTTKDGRQFTHDYTPEKTRSAEQTARLEYERQVGNPPIGREKAIRIEITIYKSIPKSASKKKLEAIRSGSVRPGKKPDVDNIVKLIIDGLNKVAYADDKQIVEIHAAAYYGETPRVEVTIHEIAENG